MNRRRTFLKTLWAGLLAAPRAMFSQSRTNRAEVIHRQPLPAPFESWEAEFNLVTIAPGPGHAPHRHRGFVLGYVLEGAFRFAIDGQPEQALEAGKALYEPPGVTHTVSASASPTKDTRILAIIIAPKDAGGK